MERTAPALRAALFASLVLPLVACEAQKSSNPLSPSVAGPIAGVDISAPRMVEPSAGAKYRESQQPIRLSVENASSTGVRPLFYTFEVATDSGFATKVFARSGVQPGDGRTSVQLDRLELGRTYHWRVRAEDGANSGPFTASSFEVLPRAQLGSPGLVSPVNNQVSSSRRPGFTVVAPDKNAAVGALRYEFQVGLDPAFGQPVAAGMVDEQGIHTTFTPASDLVADRHHFWRARATDGETTSNWSEVQTFRTPGSVSPGPSPSPGPGPGPGPAPPGNCASNNGPAIAACIAAKYPERLRPVGSLAERQTNMAFLRDRMIEAGKCGGLDLGWNLKRGGPELSIDFLVQRVGGENIGIDIGIDYDNISTPLVLVWGVHGPGAFYAAYPSTPCQ